MKKNKYSKFANKVGLIIVAVIVLLVLIKTSRNFLFSSPLFKVKAVIYTGALKPLLVNDAFNLKGKNTFSVDIRHLERDIKSSYPYLTKIRASRITPDKIWFHAEERVAVARVRLANKVFLCDEEGAILPLNNQPTNLVLISGIDAAADKIRIGEIYNSNKLENALVLLKEIKAVKELRGIPITAIDMSNPEGTAFFLNKGIKVIMGDEQIKQRLRVLILVLINTKAEQDNIKYIDLRFQEPAIGKK